MCCVCNGVSAMVQTNAKRGAKKWCFGTRGGGFACKPIVLGVWFGVFSKRQPRGAKLQQVANCFWGRVVVQTGKFATTGVCFCKKKRLPSRLPAQWCKWRECFQFFLAMLCVALQAGCTWTSFCTCLQQKFACPCPRRQQRRCILRCHT